MKSAERIAKEEKLIEIVKTLNHEQLIKLNELLDLLQAQYNREQTQQKAE